MGKEFTERPIDKKMLGVFKKYHVTRSDGKLVRWCFILELRDPVAANTVTWLNKVTLARIKPSQNDPLYTVERLDGDPVTPFIVLEDTNPLTPAALMRYAEDAALHGYKYLSGELKAKARELLTRRY